MAPTDATRKPLPTLVEFARIQGKQLLLIFLDFDGVLHRFDFGPRDENELNIFDSRCFHCKDVLEQAVRDIEVEGVAVRIVLTTSWRKHVTGYWLSVSLDPFLGSRVVGATPVLDDFGRDGEIVEFIDDAGSGTPFIVIDDNGDIFRGGQDGEYAFVREHLVLTDPETGLVPGDAARIVGAAMKALCQQSSLDLA